MVRRRERRRPPLRGRRAGVRARTRWPAAELHDAAAFGLLVRSLVADARFARDAVLTMREWAAFLCKLVEAYVGAAGRRRGGAAGALPAAPAFARRTSTSGERARALPRRLRAGARAASRRSPGARAGEGVVVSTLARAAAGARSASSSPAAWAKGSFPSPDAEDPLDLRWARRREGDVTARDRDKYAFLELLLGVRDRLYLSYVSREPLTGDALAPVVGRRRSSCTRSTRGYVRDAVVAAAPPSAASLGRRAYFPELFAPARSRAAARHDAPARGARRGADARAARSLDAARTAASTPDDVAARARAADPAWAALADHLGLDPPPRRRRPSPTARVVVPMHAIVKFLEFPLQGWARFRVGLDEVDDDDPTGARGRAVRDGRPRERRASCARCCSTRSRGGARSSRRTTTWCATRELRGAGPSGRLRAGRARATTSDARDVARRSSRRAASRTARWRSHRFGRAGRARARRAGARRAGARRRRRRRGGRARVVRVEIGGPHVAARGRRGGVDHARRSARSRSGTTRGPRRSAIARVLRAFVDHAVLGASGVAADGRTRRSSCVRDAARSR